VRNVRGQATGRSSPGAILAVLSLGGGCYALLQSLVVPALPVLQRDLHTSTSGVAWVFTAYLLAASVITPIAGRLGDMFGKKRVLVLTLVGLGVGTLISALAHSLPLMLAGRAIQGLGGAIFALAYGIIRDEFPPERVANAIALISGILGIGAGIGIVIAGPILNHVDYHWLFWIPLAAIVISVFATIALIPESRDRPGGSVHWLGAILLSGWLIALLVAVSEAPTWGWGSPKTLGLLAASAGIAVIWVWAENRSRHPLVDMKVMRLHPVWTTNLAAFLVGFGMYSGFVLLPQFVQTPASSGYGFGASVTESGFFLIPSTLMLLIFAPLAGRLSNAVGPKVPLLLGCIGVTLAFVVLAATADERWQIYFASTLLGIGVAFAFAALPILIVRAVPPDQTSVASGMNVIVRTIGGAIGAEVAASILASDLLANGYPSAHAYTVTFVICAAVVGIGIFASLLVPRSRRVSAGGPVPVAEPATAVD
jgi:EmrB/QacA subfamily drug resistance transporter